jgi:hypothetical protein
MIFSQASRKKKSGNQKRNSSTGKKVRNAYEENKVSKLKKKQFN